MNIKSFSKRLLKNAQGQGMVEYILMLVVVVAIIFAMKDRLKNYVSEELFGSLKEQISQVLGN